MTLYKPRPYGTTKEAAARLVTKVGGIDRAASFARVSRSTMQRYTDPAAADVEMPIDVVATLEAVAQDCPVTAHLAALAGMALLPVLVRPDAGTLARDLAKIGQEIAELMQEYAESQADGRTDGTEARRMLREIDDGMAAMATMRAHLQAVVDEGENGA